MVGAVRKKGTREVAMLEDSPAPVADLAAPTVIDAHLMYAALDGVAVVLDGGGVQARGRFDLADGFAEIGFIDQSADRAARGPLRGEVSAEYFFEGTALHRFSTRIVGRTAGDRYRLARPRRIAKSERRSVPRFRMVGRVDYTFDFGPDSGAPPAELADLSNQGARLLVSRSAGLERGGQQVSGWLRLDKDAAIPVVLEVRHVAPYDVGRVSVGVRFAEIRPVDRIRLTRHIVGMPSGTAA